MQTVSSNFLAAVQGSTTPVFTADLWKDGTFIASLPLESASVAFDANNNVQGSCSLVVADADGSLTPTSTGSPFTPFGASVNIRAGFQIGTSVETVSLGWFLIWDMEIEEAWATMTDSFSNSTLVRKGSRITASGRDFMQKIVDYKFLAPTAPTKSTVWAEIQYLVGDVVQTITPSYSGYADVALANQNITYGEDRMEAVKALAGLLQAEPVMTVNGQLTLKPINPVQSAANTAPTFGFNINTTEYKKTLTRDGVYNVVVAQGKGTDSTNLVAYAVQDAGAYSFYGAMGPRPVFYSSDLLTTSGAVQAWATSLLSTTTTQNTQTVPIKALPNPAIELGDYVSFTMQGTSAMQGVSVTARIVAFTYSSEGEMDVTISLPQNWIG